MDVSLGGAGGVWYPEKSVLAPVVWCIEWPEEMNIRFVTFENPEGDISVSDLELAAVLLGCMVLEDLVDTKWKHIGILCDNTPAVAWACRGASKYQRQRAGYYESWRSDSACIKHHR